MSGDSFKLACAASGLTHSHRTKLLAALQNVTVAPPYVYCLYTLLFMHATPSAVQLDFDTIRVRVKSPVSPKPWTRMPVPSLQDTTPCYCNTFRPLAFDKPAEYVAK